MTQELISLYKRLLFAVPNTTPRLKTYAIVDSVRDESVNEKVAFSMLNHVDLWHEEFWENEQDVPLYLVELEKDNDFTDYILSQHNESIATYFISPYGLEALRAYYRMFTLVTLEQEIDTFERVLFGFYDPNVLPEYVESLHNEDKIDEFFMGTAMWLMPNIEKEEILYIAFRDKKGNIEDVNIDLIAFENEPFPSLDFQSVSLPNTPNLQTYAHEVSIEYAQLQIMEEIDRKKFIKKLFKRAQKDDYIFYGDIKENQKTALVLLNEAENIGINADDEDNLYRYIVLSLLSLRPLQEMFFYKKFIEANMSEKERILKDALWTIVKEKRREDELE